MVGILPPSVCLRVESKHETTRLRAQIAETAKGGGGSEPSRRPIYAVWRSWSGWRERTAHELRLPASQRLGIALLETECPLLPFLTS